VLANEFLDALPVHSVVVEVGRLREQFVAWRDGRFVWQPGELSDPRLAEWFLGRGVELREGQRAEVNLAMLDWLGAVAAQLERGYVLILDYGAPAAELYGESRQHGTLRGFRAHHVGSDVLSAVGHQDITSHVDLDALQAAADTVGLHVLGRTTQAEFLVGLGLEELLAEHRLRAGEEWNAQLLLRSTAGRLLDPGQLGGYAVVVLGKGVGTQPSLRGLSFRLR
jgi:SAM-dependent MidA family methyltransferase